ncbi:hypothetical protein QBC38DRAFT_511470 [Podospora fimiseda]|uniref:Uncharacterized protein n=1 Tax=Podospora fimiseda TaxID=252190 RepID=A0AAN7BK67_9PEZI|nr:hypothetical protein QBC38DRAFT_511470 [Podospora fimiseda]
MPVMGATKVEYAFGSDPDRIKNHPRMFKKHKLLPHPQKDVTSVNDLQRSGSRRSTRRRARNPEPPPTPPANSRTSSAAHPADVRPGPNGASSPAESTETVDSQQPVTPPNQQTPPTPNLTPDQSPPGPAARQVKPRPPISERLPSKITIASRTESWRTAPENPESSDAEDGLPSSKTSQSTVRQLNGDAKGKQPDIVGLGLGLESTTQEFQKFDGEWAEGEASLISEVEEEWDQNLGRNVMVKKKRQPITHQREGNKQEVLQDSPVTPTMATKSLRSISLQESPLVYPRRPTASEVSISSDMKRSSIVSTTSTIVENAPQRRKTLRHVRKQSLLRDSCSDLSPSSSAPTSVSATVEDQRRGRLTGYRLGDAARESQASTTTFNSISSRKARKEVIKTGGIPVVIVPERRSSVKSQSRPPSLRSTSSRRSQSVGSAHHSQSSKSRDQHGPVFERPRRHSRTRSESDGSRPGDERTIDFPPVIPSRSSSLSAPTSRNVSRTGSRTGSLTADSLRAHNASQAQQAHKALQDASRELDSLCANGQPKITHRRPTVIITGRVMEPPEVVVEHDSVNGWRRDSDHDEELGERNNSTLDLYGDPFWGKRLSAQNTPFSVASVETAGTSHAEVSEAMAVNIYPHQSKSVVLVDHAAKPSESSSINFNRWSDSNPPTIKLTGTNGGAPSTPPQQFIEENIVDSPLRNPRAPPAPPKPPAINFIPATPSGYTPIAEKQHMMGNYFEVTGGGEKPKRSLSLLRQTLTRGRTTRDPEYGPSASRPLNFLTRRFSLSRSKSSSRAPPRLRRSSSADDRPADETRLHPTWRPAYLDHSDSSSCSSDGDDEEYYQERTYKYPPIDNRPSSRYYTSQPPRRSLSARLKRTFAILPQQPESHDYHDDAGPERRTIRRTPSGNLRVMKFRRSMESLRRVELVDNGPVPARPTTAPGEQSGGGGGSRAGRFFERKLPGGLMRSLSLGRSRTLPNTTSSSFGYGGGNLDDRPTFGDRINISRRLSERRREKRSQELRKIISGPREVRDGVGEVIKRNSWGTRGAAVGVNCADVGGRTVVRRRGRAYT